MKPSDDSGSAGHGGAGDHRAGIERAREALAQAKADARRRGAEGGDDGAARGRPRWRRPVRGGGDPQLLRAAIGDLLADRGWEQQAAVGGVFGRWPDIVGHELAEHTRPESFVDGVLVVSADSTAWATQVRLLATTMVRRLNEELGDDLVRRVQVRGPTAPDWRKGPLRAPGSRGPRDTYG